VSQTNSETEEKATASSEEEEKALLSTEEEETKESAGEISSLEGSILEGAPPVVARLLEKAPPQVRREVVSFFSMMMSRGPMPDLVASKLADKITEDHLNKLIDSSDRDRELGFKNTQFARLFQFGIAIIGLSFSGFLVVQLKSENPELLKDLIIAVAGFLGGLGTGLGFGLRKRRS
jgi:hypothetical protein